MKKFVFVLQNGKKLNKNQFISYFEKKVLYTIRKYRLLEKIKFENKCNINIEDFFVVDKIADVFISKECLDDIALKVLEIFMSKTDINKKMKVLLPSITVNKKIFIRPFYLMTRKEIELYAKLKCLKIKLKCLNINLEKQKSTKFLASWLDVFEQKHPEVNNAIVNSLLSISNGNDIDTKSYNKYQRLYIYF